MGASLVSAMRAAGASVRGELPPRYGDPMKARFHLALAPLRRPGMSILDVGAGRRPMFAPAVRPEGTVYVGLDASAAELEAAPSGAYDEIVVADVAEHRRELDGRFDAVVSWWVLEHVEPLDRALANLWSYLRPGGRLVSMLSGSLSVFSLAKRVLPDGVASRLIAGTSATREQHDVFPARYDRCTYWELREMLERLPWASFEVRPYFRGADQLAFSRVARAAYLGVEELLVGIRRPNLATNYLIVGERPR